MFGFVLVRAEKFLVSNIEAIYGELAKDIMQPYDYPPPKTKKLRDPNYVLNLSLIF
jgi:hypothetical protein